MRQRSGYIYKYGGWDYGERANYGLGDAVADTGIGAAKWAWSGIAGVSEATYGGLARAHPQYWSTGRPLDMPSVRYFEYSNQVQANAGHAMTALSFLSGAFVRGRAPVFVPAGFTTSGASTGLTTVQYEQYSLRAMKDGMYPLMQRGFKDPVGSVFLKEGDVWKFGQTINGPERYSGAFMRNNGLVFKSEFKTLSFKDVLQVERQKIIGYEQRFGVLLLVTK